MRTTVSKSFLIPALLAVVATGAAPAKKPAVEPEAIAALEKMGMYLRQQQSFAVQTTSETDVILDNGQEVQQTTRGKVRVRRPDHLRAEQTSDKQDREFFYDGKTFTMNGKKIGLYTTVPAPPTIIELADELEERYDIELPLVDLFRWGNDSSALKEITAGGLVDRGKLDGVDVDHYAFRQPGLDWQIWIQHGDKPLPRKIVLTNTEDKARPDHSITMSWDLDEKFDDSTFAFKPDKDSMKIAIEEIKPQRSAKR